MNTKLSKIGIAVAAALAANSAFALDQASTNAAPTQLVAAGASAARDAFLLIFADEVCVAGTVNVYRANPTTDQDFRAYSCTLRPSAGAGGIPELGSVGGTNATLFYRSEGGSAWGPVSVSARQTNAGFTGIKALDTTATCTAPANANFTIGTRVLVLPTSNCNATYAVPGSGLSNDAGTGAIVNKNTQLAVADVEPKMFVGANYPSSTRFQAPNVASATAVANNLRNLTTTTGFGQVFGILVNTTGGSTSTITNLKSQDVTSIFTGSYFDWSSVGAASNSITVVRREPGSGTQVSAAQQFLNTSACSGSQYTYLTDSDAPGAPDTDLVIERGTTSSLESTVGGTADSIGINVYKDPAPGNTRYVSIDGVAPSRANAANGTYKFAYELTLTKSPVAAVMSGTNANAFADALIAVSKRAALVPDIASAFAIPSATNVPGSTVSGRPVALGTRGGNSCLPFQGQ